MIILHGPLMNKTKKYPLKIILQYFTGPQTLDAWVNCNTFLAILGHFFDFGQKNLKIKIFQNKIICIHFKAITTGSHLKQKLGLYDQYWVQNDFLSTVRQKHPSYLEIYHNLKCFL